MPNIMYECLDCGETSQSYSTMKSHCELHDHMLGTYDADEEES